MVLFVLCAAGAWWYADAAKNQFGRAYTKYQIAASVQQNAAFTPGADANPLRATLNQTLALLLTKETKVPERLSLAKQGLALIGQMNTEVDAIGEAAPAVERSIATMQIAADAPGNVLHRSVMVDMVHTAHQQMSTIEDIRGLSYRANFEITQICNHIIADNGALTNEYATQLNDDLPAMEAEFNKRENAYADLQSSMYTIQKLFAGFSGSVL